MPLSRNLVIAVQKLVGVLPDADPQSVTWSAIYKAISGREWVEPTGDEPGPVLQPHDGPELDVAGLGLQKQDWPLEANAKDFFGYPPQIVRIVPPYPMRMWDSGWKTISLIGCNAKVAASLSRCLKAIWDYYGHDLKKVQAVGMDVYDGCYNDRNIAGSSRKSMHSYAAAIDFDAADNPLGATKWMMPDAVISIFEAEGWRSGAHYKGRKDAMHFEACT